MDHSEPARRARLAAQGIKPDQIDAMIEILATIAPGYHHVPSRQPAAVPDRLRPATAATETADAQRGRILRLFTRGTIDEKEMEAMLAELRLPKVGLEPYAYKSR